MKRYVWVVALLALAACQDSFSPASEAKRDAALLNADGNLAGQYIVVLNWDTDAGALAAQYGVQPRYIYEQLINGFAGAIPDNVVQLLAADPRVLRISVQRQLKKLETITTAASWGLDRVDQRLLPVDGFYKYDVDAANVHAYVIDTGVRYSHTQFEGRATLGFDAYASDPADALLYDGTGDCDGHGTHVAGTIGGKTYGIAKKVQIVGIRVLNCAGYGSDADVIAGMDWVAKNGILPAVANMSLGDIVPSKKLGTSTEIDNAVKAMVASGISVSVAAGNGYGDGLAPGYNSCDYPIANVPEAITVGATLRSPSSSNYTTDMQTEWTSFGPCVDVYAPGDGIISSYATNDNATATLGGTSMATPHVTGVAALVLAQAPGATPAQVADVIVKGATAGVLQKNPDNLTAAADPTPVLLLYSRVKPPLTLKKNGKPVPCTPRRQHDGTC